MRPDRRRYANAPTSASRSRLSLSGRVANPRARPPVQLSRANGLRRTRTSACTSIHLNGQLVMPVNVSGPTLGETSGSDPGILLPVAQIDHASLSGQRSSRNQGTSGGARIWLVVSDNGWATSDRRANRSNRLGSRPALSAATHRSSNSSPNTREAWRCPSAKSLARST